MVSTDWNLLTSYAGILTLATTSVYLGSVSSLPRKRKKTTSNDSSTEDEYEYDSEDQIELERLNSSDAWLFPIIGSVTLLSLFLAIKYLGKERISLIVGWYLSLASIGSVWKSSETLTRFMLGKWRWKGFGRTRATASEGSKDMTRRTPSLILMFISAAPSILFSCTQLGRRSILLANILALSFCHTSISMLRLDSFKTGIILLSCLFFYDIGWVFCSDVMVSVATSLDVPIKLQWPKSMKFSATAGYTMLGLGDIIIPGCFVSLALRYDSYISSTRANDDKRISATPYFYAAMWAYVAGLISTIIIMDVFQAAQPALLYLSPACIGSFIFTAYRRGELLNAWNWKDNENPSLESLSESQSLTQVKEERS